MANLIEADAEGKLPETISMRQGDVLSLPATGGKIIYGAAVIEILGPFYPAFLSAAGELFTPMGSPNQLMLLARSSGAAAVEVWSQPQEHKVYTITVT